MLPRISLRIARPHRFFFVEMPMHVNVGVPDLMPNISGTSQRAAILVCSGSLRIAIMRMSMKLLMMSMKIMSLVS
jgi:hypothetical protein